MTRTIFAAALASAAVALAPTGAAAGTLPFTGTQTNFSPPGDLAGRCAPALTVSFINSAPYFATGASNLGTSKPMAASARPSRTSTAARAR